MNNNEPQGYHKAAYINRVVRNDRNEPKRPVCGYAFNDN